MELTVGIQGHAEALVEKEDTAQVVGSGDLLVYATPCMVALMEGAACESIAPCLAEGESSVGTMMHVVHSSATPVGMEVRAEAEVTAVEGSTVTFAVTAYDEAGKIGEGIHKRVIINTQEFLDKAYSKL